MVCSVMLVVIVVCSAMVVVATVVMGVMVVVITDTERVESMLYIDLSILVDRYACVGFRMVDLINPRSELGFKG